MNANPTLIHLAQLLAGRCPRRLLQSLLREAERAKDPGPGEDRGKTHQEVDRLLALYRERGYWARARVNVAFLETPLFLTAELDLVVADGGRAAVVEVKTGEVRLEPLFQALLAWAAWARLESRVGLKRKTFAVLWRPGQGFPLYLKVPDPSSCWPGPGKPWRPSSPQSPRWARGARAAPWPGRGVARRAWPTLREARREPSSF